MGTAGINQVIADRPVMEPANLGYNICYVPQGNYLRLLPTMTNTPTFNGLHTEFFAAERQAADKQVGPTCGMSWTLAGTIPLGSYGVMYHPYIDPAGERSPFVCSSARAQFTGLSVQHGRHVMLRAVYEGVALSLLDCYDTMGVPVTELRLAGGGARSGLWAQILADALGCRVVVADGQEYGPSRHHQRWRRCWCVRVVRRQAWPALSAPPGTLRPILPGVKITPSSYRSIAACVKLCSPFGSSAHNCYSVSQKAFKSDHRALARRRNRR